MRRLSLIACLMLLALCAACALDHERGAASAIPSPPGPQPETRIFSATLPLADRAWREPLPPVAVYDCAGAITSTWWLTTTFGAVSWMVEAQNEARLAEVRACCGDCSAVIVAHVGDGQGAAVEGATVVFYWPDAPILPEELRNGPYDRGVYGPTNAEGLIGFGLGHGSYYWPPAAGPHVLWVGGVGSDRIQGLGMIGETNHEHLDPGWVLSEEGQIALRDWGTCPTCPIRPALWNGHAITVVEQP